MSSLNVKSSLGRGGGLGTALLLAKVFHLHSWIRYSRKIYEVKRLREMGLFYIIVMGNFFQFYGTVVETLIISVLMGYI